MNLLIACLKVLIVYDFWCIGRVAALLRWLEEWLSISQKWAERSMIALFMLLVMVPSVWKLGVIVARIGVAACVGLMMWQIHRRPAARRELWKRNPSMMISRALLQVIILYIAALLMFSLPRPGNYTNCIAQIVYLIFFYSTDIYTGGEPGRRRKLAWAELKKLFGMEWIPKPAPAPAN